MVLNDIQKRTVSLMDAATTKEKLKKWVHGYIPEHYKRLNISKDEALSIAIDGARECFAYFETKLYFTQALIAGACLYRKYNKIIAVTPSQYGKSWVCGQIGLICAANGGKVIIAAADDYTASLIMQRMIDLIQNADAEIKNKLIESADKIERLQIAASKKRLAFKGGGAVECLSFGAAFSDSKRGNKLIGAQSDLIMIDEASLINDDKFAEAGRGEFSSDKGEKNVSLQISNPHNPGRFFESLTNEYPTSEELIIWMDIRTALEEGRWENKEYIMSTEIFANKSTCKRYLLCELEDMSEEALFPEPIIDDSKTEGNSDYFIGIDSAYKGVDEIKVVLLELKENGSMRIAEHTTIHKGEWIQGKTSENIVRDILRIINAYKVKMACIDIGYGVWLVESLTNRTECIIRGINFGENANALRKKAGHYSSVFAQNKRAEMHIDMQDLMENGKLTFSSNVANDIQKQMSVVKALRAPNGKIGILSKKEIKQLIGKSPDLLDASLLSIHAAILYFIDEPVLIYSGGE